MFIVSAVKICKQCLQTALISGGLVPWTPLGDFGPQNPWVIAPKWKFLALPLICRPTGAFISAKINVEISALHTYMWSTSVCCW